MAFCHIDARVFVVVIFGAIFEVEGVCVDGWSEAPSGACWKVSQDSTWMECTERCGGHALACIASNADNEFAYALLNDTITRHAQRAFIGNTQTSVEAGPDANWGRCPNDVIWVSNMVCMYH